MGSVELNMGPGTPTQYGEAPILPGLTRDGELTSFHSSSIFKHHAYAYGDPTEGIYDLGTPAQYGEAPIPPELTRDGELPLSFHL